MDRRKRLVFFKARTARFQWSHFFSEMDREEGDRNEPFSKTSFNGATSFQKWIDLVVRLTLLTFSPFQWSHFFSEMDRLVRRDHKIGVRKVFQWSHFFSEMDRVACCFPGRSRDFRFNGATSFQKWIADIKIKGSNVADLGFQWSHFFSEMDRYSPRKHRNLYG